MKDEDLEKTRPIETLVDFEVNQSRLSRTKMTESESRLEKFKDAEKQEQEQELNELAEEALAEKNIAIAETLLKEEKESKENKENKKTNNDKKKHKLTEKQKTIILVVAGIVVVAILAVVMYLIFKKPKVENKPATTPSNSNVVTEEPPEIVDNYYYQDGKLHLLSAGSSEIGTYECNNQDENLCYVALNNYRDDFDVGVLKDENGNLTEQRLKIYNNDYVFINDNSSATSKEIVLYSIISKKVVNTYTDVKAFKDNYIIVKDSSNKYGLIQINEDVKEIIKPQYSYLGMIEGQENLIAKSSKGYAIIDKQNKTLSATLNNVNTIKNYNDNFIVTYQDKRYNVYNYEAELLAGDYTFATIADEFIGLVKSKKLYVRDIEGNKLNEDGIPLKNIAYVREYIYDNEKQLKETKRSFSLSQKKDSVEVIVFNADVNEEPEYFNLEINLGKVNAKYDYLNYFSGKLYIYSDKEKDKLLGSYKCNNENTIENEESTLDTCMIAKDTIYEDNELIKEEDEKRNNTIPIINNKFVFVKDGSDIYLIDLTKTSNPVLGTYLSVNTYTGSNGDAVTTYSGTVNVIALSKKSNKYGMINIENGTATSVYSFDYEAMEKIGTFIMAKVEHNNWVLLNGPKSTNAKYPGKIVNYSSDKKYFKVLQDNKYAVYDVDAKKIGESSYKELLFYNNFYLGVNDSNELYLYNYKGETITNKAIKVGNTCSLNETYKVEFKNNKYTISVCNGDKYDISVYDASKNKFEGSEEEEVIKPVEPIGGEEDIPEELPAE